MNGLILAFAVLCAGAASAQIYLNQPVALALQHHQPVHQEASLAHPAVVENARNEAQYPSELRGHVYDNPRVAEALAKESWFGDKEMPVFERAADKIPRERIVKIFKNAGFVRRR
uniref:Putative conserved secreted protein n=1 Tax=Culex tarsalis TaxID=7177 RepID=A0A1Q3FS48_CULTA